MLTPQTEFADKKVVLFAVPGAFTPSCSVKHLPGYIENGATLKSKGVDIIAVIAYNDAYVMSAWGKANGIKDDSIVRPPFLVPDFQSPTLFTSPNPRHP
jgi:alkyl hydroperoxide reductase 1